jgi:hypothetical protein
VIYVESIELAIADEIDACVFLRSEDDACGVKKRLL